MANFEPECRAKLGINSDANHIAFFNKDAAQEFVTFGENEVSLDALAKVMTVNMARGTPKWGQPAFACFTEYHMSLLVYLKDIVGSYEEVLDDWRLELMHEMNKDMQMSQDSTFLSLVWSWDHDKSQRKAVPPILDYIKVEKEDLPGLFLLSPVTGDAIRFPEEGFTLQGVSPELIMGWARFAGFEREVEFYRE